MKIIINEYIVTTDRDDDTPMVDMELMGPLVALFSVGLVMAGMVEALAQSVGL